MNNPAAPSSSSPGLPEQGVPFPTGFISPFSVPLAKPTSQVDQQPWSHAIPRPWDESVNRVVGHYHTPSVTASLQGELQGRAGEQQHGRRVEAEQAREVRIWTQTEGLAPGSARVLGRARLRTHVERRPHPALHVSCLKTKARG